MLFITVVIYKKAMSSRIESQPESLSLALVLLVDREDFIHTVNGK